MNLVVVPIDFDEACMFVGMHHRHHIAPVGHKFSIACAQRSVFGEDAVVFRVIGVAIVGRPVSRHQEAGGWTLEVTRLCTDGTRNACSMLYGAARKAAFALGYNRLITYTLPEEGGASLRGAGIRLLGERRGGSWSVPSRPRIDKHPLQGKLLWEASP